MEDILYLKNENLRTIKKDYLGNKYKNNRFLNIYGHSGSKKLGDILKWKLSRNPQSLEKKRDNYKLKVIKDENLLDSNDDFIVWLGHATFLIQIDGKKIITDPCLTSPPFIRRLTELPIDITKIKPDYILISHGHYDHLDKNSIKEFDNSSALIPLGMKKEINSMNSTIKTEEALQAFKDLKAKEFIPMHFGTFDLSDEPLGEPEAILREIGKDENIIFLNIGDKLYLN